MNEQARRLQMGVAGEIQIIDLGALENNTLLCTDMWCEEQHLIADPMLRQVRSAAVQLLDDDSNVLMAEVSLFRDKVSNRPPRGLPGDNAIETGEGLSAESDLGLGQPPVEDGPIQIEIRRVRWSSHVRNSSMFINNEQDNIMNILMVRHEVDHDHRFFKPSSSSWS
jgi:hypothetical protein